jgi:TPR repeat protein
MICAQLNIHALRHQLYGEEPQPSPSKELNEISDLFSGTCSDSPLSNENEQLVTSKCQAYLSPSDLSNSPQDMCCDRNNSLQDLAYTFHRDGNSYAAQVIFKNVFLHSSTINPDGDNSIREAKAQCWAKVQLGDIQAQFELGCLFLTEGKSDEAMMYFLGAAEAGNTDANLYLGQFYSLAGNVEYAQLYFDSIDKQDDVHTARTSSMANFVLGHKHHTQWIKTKNEDDLLAARTYFSNSAKDGYQPAIEALKMANFVLGHKHHTQWIKTKNEDDLLAARTYFSNSAKDGYQPAIDAFKNTHDPHVGLEKSDLIPMQNKLLFSRHALHEDL